MSPPEEKLQAIQRQLEEAGEQWLEAKAGRKDTSGIEQRLRAAEERLQEAQTTEVRDD